MKYARKYDVKIMAGIVLLTSRGHGPVHEQERAGHLRSRRT